MMYLIIKSTQSIFLRIVYVSYHGYKMLIERASAVGGFEGAEMHMAPVAMV